MGLPNAIVAVDLKMSMALFLQYEQKGGGIVV